MSAFMIATISIKNPEKFQEYAEKVPATVIPFGGELLIKGKFTGALTGEADHQMAGVVKFPDLESIDNWFNSDAYQALIPLRNEGADVQMTKYLMPTA